MLYVLGEIVVWMVAAFLLGGLVGWFLRAVGKRQQSGQLNDGGNRKTDEELAAARADADQHRTRALQLDAELARLSARHDKERARLQAELTELSNQRNDELAAHGPAASSASGSANFLAGIGTAGAVSEQLTQANRRADAAEARGNQSEQSLDSARQHQHLLEQEFALLQKEADRARSQAEAAALELDQLRRSTADLEARLRDTDSSRNGFEQQLALLADEHRSGTEELAQVRQDHAAAQRQLNGLDDEHRTVRAELDNLRDTHATLQQDLARLQDDKATQQGELAELRGSRAAMEAQVLQLRNGHQAQEADLAALRNRQADLVGQLAQTRADLEGVTEVRRGLEARLADAQQLRSGLEADLESTRAEGHALSADLRQTAEHNDELARELEAERQRQLALQQDVDAARHSAAEHEAARRSFAEQLSQTRLHADNEQAALRAEIAQREAVLRASEAKLVDLEDRLATPEPDDLRLISGVGPVLERLLNESGITTFRQLARLSEGDMDNLDHRLDEFSGRVRHEGWVEQARLLHRDKYGDDPLRN